jgi:hypothetical protein
MQRERRNLVSIGRKRRRDFDRSLQKLRALGLPEWAVEYYRRVARVAGLTPHMVLCHVGVVAANRLLEAHLIPENGGPAEKLYSGIVSEPLPAEPSYEAARGLGQRVTNLWREIQQQSSLLGVPDGGTASPRPEEKAPSAGKPAHLRAAPSGNAAGEELRSRRRGKVSSRHH